MNQKKIVPIIVRPFFLYLEYFSCCGNTDKLSRFLLWNPLLHASELFREYIFTDFQSPQGAFPYLFLLLENKPISRSLCVCCEPKEVIHEWVDSLNKIF